MRSDFLDSPSTNMKPNLVLPNTPNHILAYDTTKATFHTATSGARKCTYVTEHDVVGSSYYH